MTISEEDLAGRIVRSLDGELAQIDQQTLAKLRAARETALERMQSRPVWSLAWASTARGRTSFRSFNPRHLLSAGALLAAISVMVYWQRPQPVEYPVDIDAKLLSSDLPIDALLDKGLDSWLRR